MNVLSTEERLQICSECPIYNASKSMCNPLLWINPKTNEISARAKSGYIKGCGCLIKVKAKNPLSHCIAGKW